MATNPIPAAVAKADSRLAESIAKETDTPVEVVKLIFEEEFSAICANAKITQYAGVIASRRVKLRLQKH
ncbi:MAG TPA: DUF3562 domain-containing protein [Povalibacter sp.]|nr:DUF3562 domain-containing protein [Povalibacter sp.]